MVLKNGTEERNSDKVMFMEVPKAIYFFYEVNFCFLVQPPKLLGALFSKMVKTGGFQKLLASERSE